MIILIYAVGSKYYFSDLKNQNLHNSYGCSRKSKFGRARSYWINNKLHNEKGPAVIYNNGACQFWLKNIRFSEKYWKKNLDVHVENIEIVG